MNDLILNLSQHLEYIKKNNYENVVESIVGDMLMNKVKLVNQKLKVNINEKILNLIQEWYYLAKNLQNISSSKYITVYRGVYDMSEEETIIQPIPFSTSLLISACYDWIENRENSFIMKINVPLDSLYTMLGNKNEGWETILSSGFLRKKKEEKQKNKKSKNSMNFYNNKKIIEYDFESIDFLEMKNLIKKLNS